MMMALVCGAGVSTIYMMRLPKYLSASPEFLLEHLHVCPGCRCKVH